MISKIFIERPVLANVIALIIVFIGIIAIFVLPISQYPAIVPPTIQVNATYPGADAKTLIKTVALPIESQVNGVEKMLYMQSTSTNNGSYNLIVTFAIGTDPNFAQVLVQNRVQAAMAQLPQAVQRQGVTVQQNSTAVLQFITLTAKHNEYDGLFLNNYATINLLDELSRLPGVANVKIFGSGNYAMRVWLDPQKMMAFALNPSEVLDAINSQNKEVSAGTIAAPPVARKQAFQFTVNVPGQLADPDEFANIIIKSNPTKPNEAAYASSSARIIRIRDVGRVELGSSSYTQSVNLNGKPTAAIGIFQIPDSNALKVAEDVRRTMQKMSKNFPPGLQYSIPFDTTIFVKKSIDEVYTTLAEAGILVLLVILAFLQNFRAMLVPATTIPITIIGAFIGILLLGYTINLLTLFAVVLAIGIVVDDAIVIVEGVTQHIERGSSPKDAAITAMGELFAPILSITLVLMAVFLPAGFMPGLTGQMYAQFALVIAVTALISAINAVTLKPTQCALWLRPIPVNQQKNYFYLKFNYFYERLETAYIKFIERLTQRSKMVGLIGVVLMVLAILGLTRLPTSLIPIEDQGYILLNVQLPDGASLERTEVVLKELSRKVSLIDGIQDIVQINGISILDNNASLANAGVLYIIFKDWSKRGRSENLLSLYNQLNQLAKDTINAKVLVVVPPAIQGLGLSGGYQMQVELKDGTFDYLKLQGVTDKLVQQGLLHPEVHSLLSPFRAAVPQITLPIDRTKAESLGVPIGQAFDTLQTYLGSSYVNLFTKFGQVFQVYVQAEENARMSIDDVQNYYIKNQSGNMVPLGTLTDSTPAIGPSIIPLYNLYPSSSIIGMSAPGYSSGQAMQALEKLAQQILPSGLSYEWTSTAYQEKVAGNLSYIIFALSLVFVYLILAGLYESWFAPAAIMLSVPLALIGTVLVLLMLNLANNIYTQIGILLLIALSAKNAILIAEVAREQREFQNKSIIEAAIIGAKTRFRPILMTSFAFIMGVMPLVFATGAGANARRSIGVAVCSGMLASTCLAVVFVPAYYVLLQNFQERWQKKKFKGTRVSEAN